MTPKGVTTHRLGAAVLDEGITVSLCLNGKGTGLLGSRACLLGKSGHDHP